MVQNISNMTDDKAQQEPSMEDILASIRRILSEDDVEEASQAEEGQIESAPEPEPEPDPEPAPAAQDEDEDVLELTEDMVVADGGDEDGGDDGGEEEIDPAWGFDPGAEDEDEEEAAPEPEPEPEPEPAPAPAAAEDEHLVSPPAEAASTAFLGELMRQIAQHQTLSVGDGGITIEALTREMLRPLLKEWLDQNLPEMVERLVKAEIERMVNKAKNL